MYSQRLFMILRPLIFDRVSTVSGRYCALTVISSVPLNIFVTSAPSTASFINEATCARESPWRASFCVSNLYENSRGVACTEVVTLMAPGIVAAIFFTSRSILLSFPESSPVILTSRSAPAGGPPWSSTTSNTTPGNSMVLSLSLSLSEKSTDVSSRPSAFFFRLIVMLAVLVAPPHPPERPSVAAFWPTVVVKLATISGGSSRSRSSTTTIWSLVVASFCHGSAVMFT